MGGNVFKITLKPQLMPRYACYCLGTNLIGLHSWSSSLISVYCNYLRRFNVVYLEKCFCNIVMVFYVQVYKRRMSYS